MRDTFKKLIYAMEQNQMARQATGAPNVADMQRPNSFGGKRLGRSDARMSVADHNFGVTAQSLLPNVIDT